MGITEDLYSPLSFIQSGYDRKSLQRSRKRHLKTCLADGSARLLFVFDRKVGLVKSETGYQAALVEPELLTRPARETIETIFLGEFAGHPVFSVICDEHPRQLLSLGAAPLLFFDLRQAVSQIAPASASLLGYALAMDYWHRTHRYCGVCGHVTDISDSGHVRECSNGDCGRKHFPRTDPAIIVLVHDDNHCLLGRKREWEDRRYSTIAGFVEPGETPEQAVRREVYEETGSDVLDVKYYGAQPWPFPGSLMLGYHARAEPGPVSLYDEELQDARWFSREEIIEWLPTGKLRLPTRISISYRLLQHWFDRYDGPSLNGLNPDEPR
jgi:NAD+ diphosphatase